MIQLPLERQYLVPAAVMSLLLVFFYLLPANLHEALSYQRELIAEGQWWRIMTGQLLHFEWRHLLLNVAGIWVMFLLFAEHAPAWRYAYVVIALTVLTGIGVYWLAPELQYYVGFSGVLYAIFAWGACHDIRQRIKLGYLLLFGLVLKVSWEQFFGPLGNQAATESLAVAAHFYGVLSGITVALIQISVASQQRKHH
ncbi:MAG: rhombosortase [Aliidiomarina sp.]|uniref:rhombosortase n=1 Tax=Aliidiomarina sp. TaxID=1872439 RepID=UPI0025B8CAF4|nr:rhombosortase [Aliidiomarina sp.]MCH8500550.1 rhombosortase [Aliidiomarina sp.]